MAKIYQNKQKNKKNPWVMRFIIIFWMTLLLGIAIVAGVLYGTSQGMLGSLPNIEQLENPEINVASEIYSSDGVLIDKYEKEKRIPITYNQLPKHLVQALYAREDERFEKHSGIDGEAILRAVSRAGKDGGGSTITQQLAKQLFTKKRSKNKIEAVKQKLKEWVVAVQLEKRYTKEEIITMYLNKFDFIYRANGIEAAARTYFQKDVSKLSVPESAILISMLKNPVLYNPVTHPESSKHERNVVLSQMLKLGYITGAEFDDYKNQPLNVHLKMLNSSVKESYSAYFKYTLKKEIEKYLEDYEEKNGVSYDLYRDGLKIYTTLDSRMQRLGEESIKKHLVDLQKRFFSSQKGRATAPFYNITKSEAQEIFNSAVKRTIYYQQLKAEGLNDEQILNEFNKPKDSVQYFTWEGRKWMKNVSLMDSIKYHKHIIQAGLLSINPKDGQVKAWVGGIDWDYFKFDHVKQARRQVGSTFKPFVYAAAIQQLNYTPCHEISNERITIGDWSPKNAGGSYGGTRTLRQGLAHSINTISVNLIRELGPDAVIQLARELGVESDIPSNLTIALGSSDLTLYEMVGAYSSFANKGIYIQPEMLLSLEDKNGKVLKDFQPVTREVLSEDVAYTMIDLMEGVVEQGTGRGIRRYGITAEVAGKTGTTNEGSDSWFIGLTPNLVTGVWVGNEDRAAHFPGWQSQGAKMALPIWGYFMKGVYDNSKELGVSQSDKFEKPDGLDERWDCNSKQGFYNFGNVGSMEDNHRRKDNGPNVNDLISADNDSISFE